MFFKWTHGRQNTGYKKLKIFQFLNIDCYLLKYIKGDYIPWHVDSVPNRKHYRLNITLITPKKGGILHIVNNGKLRENRISFFRSDIQEHCVTKIEEGYRLVLTFGIAI